MSMYRFVKEAGSKRLFVQGTTDDSTNKPPALGPPIVTSFCNPEEINNLQAVVTKKRLSTEVLGSSIESTKTSRKNGDGSRRITTHILRKVTTIARGEEKSVAQDLTRRAEAKSIHAREESAGYVKALEAKRVKVRFRIVSLLGVTCIAHTFVCGSHIACVF